MNVFVPRKEIVSLIVVLSCGAACARATGPYDPSAPSAQQPLMLESGQAVLRGPMGHVAATPGAEVQYQVQGIGATSQSVRIDAVDATDQWWVMVNLHLPVTVARLAQQPVGSDVTGTLSALGCSGPSFGHYTFDSSAATVTATIEDDGVPGQHSLHFWATWGIGTNAQTVEGAVAIPTS
jgi:hypothetical protein